MIENVKEPFGQYQTYFNKKFKKEGYECHIIDVDDDNINYFVTINDMNDKHISHPFKVLVYISVVSHDLTIFTVIGGYDRKAPTKKKMNQINLLNMTLLYGKAYWIDKAIAYSAKIKLPLHIESFDDSIIDECFIEIIAATQRIKLWNEVTE